MADQQGQGAAGNLAADAKKVVEDVKADAKAAAAYAGPKIHELRVQIVAEGKTMVLFVKDLALLAKQDLVALVQKLASESHNASAHVLDAKGVSPAK